MQKRYVTIALSPEGKESERSDYPKITDHYCMVPFEH